MFTTLHTLAQSAILHLAIVAEGPLLRVTLQPRATGKGAVPPALSLLATPEEFDRDFAGAVQAWHTPTTPLLEQASAAAKTVAASAQIAAPAAAKPAAKPAASAGKKKAPAAKSPAAPAKTAAPKKTPPAAAMKPWPTAPTGQTAEPSGAAETPPAASAPTDAGKDAATPAAPDAADRAACIADMRAYLDAGGKPVRAAYLKSKPATGRRYERLFKSFDELADAARQRDLLDNTATTATPPAERGPLEPAVAWPMVTDSAASPEATTSAPPTAPLPTVTLSALHTVAVPAHDSVAGLFPGEPVLDSDPSAAGDTPPSTPAATAAPATPHPPADPADTVVLDLF